VVVGKANAKFLPGTIGYDTGMPSRTQRLVLYHLWGTYVGNLWILPLLSFNTDEAGVAHRGCSGKGSGRRPWDLLTAWARLRRDIWTWCVDIVPLSWEPHGDNRRYPNFLVLSQVEISSTITLENPFHYDIQNLRTTFCVSEVLVFTVQLNIQVRFELSTRTSCH
jgi:hypothetical protein